MLGRFRTVLAFAFALVVVVQAISGRTTLGQEPPVTREAECRWASTPPTIDGRLNDPVWKTAAVIDRFPSFWERTVPGPAHATKARLLWDRQALYFSSEMTDSDVRAFGTKHNDHLWNGDVFEMFFKPSRDQPRYFEFQVNPTSVLFEATFLERGQATEPIETSRPLGMSAVARDVAQGWVAEGRIPWSAFGETVARPLPDTDWSFALCRYDYNGPEETPPILMSSAPLTQRSFHRFEDYGRLRFVGPVVNQGEGTDDSLCVVTHVDVIPPFAAAGRELLQGFASRSRQDPGAIRVDLFEELARPNHLTVVEVWASRKAYDDHLAADHVKAYRAKLQPMLGSPFDERLHRQVR